MKILALIVFLATCQALSIHAPQPACRVSPLPSLIPMSIGETVRFDLESIIGGYNLEFSAPQKDHFSITPKYSVHQNRFNQTLNFTSAKIKTNNRFLGLSAHNEATTLAVGYNYDTIGVYINHIVQVEDIHNILCFDVEEVHDSVAGKAYAMIDCGIFQDGKLKKNEFMYIDLESYSHVLGTSQHDTFVHFKHISRRRMEFITDPIHDIHYIYRFITADDVDEEHADKTYVEIFMYTTSPLGIKLFDVIDHTVMETSSLALSDYQIYNFELYLLVKNVGLYRFGLSPSQRIHRKSFVELKMNLNKFRVDGNGFNDDLALVLSNDNTVYHYEWDLANAPNLVNKYTLMPFSEVEQLFVDYNFVIVKAKAQIDDKPDRRTWIFTRWTTSYTQAFGSFEEPLAGPSIIQWQGHAQTLHLFRSNEAANIQINIPYLRISPVSSQMAGQTEEFVITATSREGDLKKECKQTLKLIYIDGQNTSIMKTGLQGRSEIYVDSPDDKEIQLQYEFFGPHLKYNVTFDTDSSILPTAYVNKEHKAVFNLPPEINQSAIIYFEMFTELSFDERTPNSVYGIIQTEVDAAESLKKYPIYYIHCGINVFDREEIHHLNCRVVHDADFTMGKIIRVSQLYDPHERRIAFVFSDKPSTVFFYYFYSVSFAYYGKKEYDNVFFNRLSDVQISKGLVIMSFELGKRLQIYRLSDFYEPDEEKKNPNPLFVIDTKVMSFFGIYYFAPVDLKVSQHHDEVVFIRCKTGIIGLNINEKGLPELVLNLPTSTSNYDFEVNRDTMMVITPNSTTLYRLQVPFRRYYAAPFVLQKFENNFTLNEYAEINSDGFFYLVSGEHIAVLHPNMPSTSILYTIVEEVKVKAIDAVRIQDKQILFAFNGTDLVAWVLAENPTLSIDWTPNSHNFTLNISAYNLKSKVEEPYTMKFNVIQSNEAEIKPTAKFNKTKVMKSGHLDVDVNIPSIDVNITLNDTEWFEGTIMHYNISCKDCHKENTTNATIYLQNKVKQVNDILASKAIYELESTHDGVFAQQYDAVFKTYKHNDSIEYTFRIPVEHPGQPCTKLALPEAHDYVLSLCEGTQVNVYMTTLESFKPFTMGPYKTGAKFVNHAKIQEDVLMIVDNDDNPFVRAGGVYLYLIDHDPAKEEAITLLDYLGYEDLQIEGFRGIPYIGSAELQRPLFNRHEYTLFITEGRTGAIFIFTFTLSQDRNEIIYLHKKMAPLTKLIPDSIHYPEPIRIMTINTIDFMQKTDTHGKHQVQYFFLLTVKNWHHLEIMITLDETANILFFELRRLFERVPYPAELFNYAKIRKGSLNGSYFAVPYVNKELQRQVVAVYELPYFDIHHKETGFLEGIPITRMMGAHFVPDQHEVSFSFRALDEHKMLFVDSEGQNMSELQLNRELKIIMKNINPQEQKPENITITAMNHYNTFNFTVELSLEGSQEGARLQIIWIIILIIGFVMIVGLVIIWIKQNKSDKEGDQNKESLLSSSQRNTVEINRSSANLDSMRGTADLDSKRQTKMKLDKEEQEQEQQQEEEQESGEEESEEEGSEEKEEGKELEAKEKEVKTEL